MAKAKKRRASAALKKKKAVVHLYTGEGAGKTTSVFGVALRCVGHGLKVIIIQFMKGRKDIGEFMIQKKLRNYTVRQFGAKSFISDLKKPRKIDHEQARKGMDFAWESIKKKPFLLVLDEAGLAASVGLVDIKELIRLTDSAHPSTAIYITGRSNPEELIDRADFVTELRTLKCPKKPEYIKGIEY